MYRLSTDIEHKNRNYKLNILKPMRGTKAESLQNTYNKSETALSYVCFYSSSRICNAKMVIALTE